MICVHGLGGTPHSVAPVTSALRQAGYPTEALLLPGHGTDVARLADVTWTEWLAYVVAAAHRARQSHPQVILVGQSLGATLAVIAATTLDFISGVVAINPLAQPADPDAVEHLEYLLARGRTMQPAGPPDIRDPAAIDVADDELPIAALIQLTRAGQAAYEAASALTAPALIVTSALDAIVDPANSDLLAAETNGQVTRLLLPRSGHVAALDYDRELLCETLLSWLVNLTDASAVLADESASS